MGAEVFIFMGAEVRILMGAEVIVLMGADVLILIGVFMRAEVLILMPWQPDRIIAKPIVYGSRGTHIHCHSVS